MKFHDYHKSPLFVLLRYFKISDWHHPINILKQLGLNLCTEALEFEREHSWEQNINRANSNFQWRSNRSERISLIFEWEQNRSTIVLILLYVCVYFRYKVTLSPLPSLPIFSAHFYSSIKTRLLLHTHKSENKIFYFYSFLILISTLMDQTCSIF